MLVDRSGSKELLLAARARSKTASATGGAPAKDAEEKANMKAEAASLDKKGAAGKAPGRELERSDTASTAATYDDIGDLSQYSLLRQWCIR